MGQKLDSRRDEVAGQKTRLGWLSPKDAPGISIGPVTQLFIHGCPVLVRTCMAWHKLFINFIIGLSQPTEAPSILGAADIFNRQRILFNPSHLIAIRHHGKQMFRPLLIT